MLVPTADILIVDDTKPNLDLLEALLHAYHYQVRAVSSGPQALEACRHHPPELILLDIAMPGMDGFETCAKLQEDPALARIPVVFISALDDTLDKVKAFQVGGRDYVTKPFQPEEVMVRVEYQIKLARLQKELEIQNANLEDANQKLKEVNTLKANFTAMLVHDLRSPLQFIAILLNNLKEGIPIKPATLNQAEEVFQRMKHLLDEMLELHRSDSGQTPINSKPINPSGWIPSSIAPSVSRAEAMGLDFQLQVAPDLPPIVGDESQLNRVLANLVDNAVKFTPKGGAIRLEAGIEFGAGVEAGLRFLKISVIDTGRGIPAEKLPYIFDPFRQVHKSDAPMGFGLGLAITQRLVSAHRGQIRVRSQVGVGTAFQVLLPC